MQNAVILCLPIAFHPSESVNRRFPCRSLELSPFNIKSLLRRAAAYEALERYRLAYVDYKTALQIDCNITAAHDGTNR